MRVPELTEGLACRAVRVIESDESSANLRCEKILDEPAVEKLHVLCAGHKIHSVAARMWARSRSLHSGIVQCLKFLKSPGMYQKFLSSLLDYVGNPDNVILSSAPLSEQAIAHRSMILELFTPSKSDRPHVHVGLRFLSSNLLNGDWQLNDGIRHRCSSAQCCRDRLEFCAKLRFWIPKMLQWLGARRFVEDDWQGWPGHLNFVGCLMHIHSVFQRVFVRTFSGRAMQVADEPLSAAWHLMQDGQEPQRGMDVQGQSEAGELAKALKISLEWLERDRPELPLYLLRLSLRVQVMIMKQFLSTTQGMFEIKAIMGPSGLGDASRHAPSKTHYQVFS